MVKALEIYLDKITTGVQRRIRKRKGKSSRRRGRARWVLKPRRYRALPLMKGAIHRGRSLTVSDAAEELIAL